MVVKKAGEHPPHWHDKMIEVIRDAEQREAAKATLIYVFLDGSGLIRDPEIEARLGPIRGIMIYGDIDQPLTIRLSSDATSYHLDPSDEALQIPNVCEVKPYPSPSSITIMNSSRAGLSLNTISEWDHHVLLNHYRVHFKLGARV